MASISLTKTISNHARHLMWITGRYQVLLLFVGILNWCPNLVAADRSYAIELSEQDSKQMLKKEQSREERQDCKAAGEEFRRWGEKIADKCGDFGAGENCIQAAASCAEKAGDNSSGGGGMGTLASILGQAMPQFMGMGSMMNPSMSGSNLNCKSTKSKDAMKRTQKELYQDAKKSYEKAEEDVSKIQEQANDLTDAKSKIQSEYQNILKNIKSLNTKLPLTKQQARETSEEKAMQLRDDMNGLIQKQADLASRQTLAQTAMTSLYPSLVGACFDKSTDHKVSADEQLFALREQYETAISQINDLRSRETEKNKGLSKLKSREQYLQQTVKQSYDRCMKQAKDEYSIRYNQLRGEIDKTNKEQAEVKEKLEIAQERFKKIPEILNAAIQSVDEEVANERSFNLAELQRMNGEVMEKTNNYNVQLQDARQKLVQRQTAFMMSEQSFRTTQSVAEASLGDVQPLLENYRTAKEEMCLMCTRGGVSPPSCKKGSDSFESDGGSQ